MADAFFFDQVAGQVALPARQDHQGAAAEDRAVHHAHQAGDVEQRQHRQHHAFRVAVDPVPAGHGVVHDRAVVVDAALGRAGGAAGVGQQAGRVRVADQHRRRQGGGQRLQPGGDGRVSVQGQVAGVEPVFPLFGHRQVLAGAAVEGVGVAGHQQPLQLLVAGQLVVGVGEFAGQLRGTDRRLGAGVADVVAQLGGFVHRVDRHHHRVGAHDRVVGDHQLRAVLHHHQHPVAGAHAGAAEPGRQGFALAQQLAVAERAVEEADRGFFRIAPRAGDQVVPQGGARRPQTFRQPRRPVMVKRVGGMGGHD